MSPNATPTVPVDEVKPAATPGTCGVAACDYGSPERGELIGAQLEMGTFNGYPEVLYAARDKGFDTSTGKPLDSVAVISTGIVVEGKLRRTVWGFQPDEDQAAWGQPNEDQGGPVGLYGGQRTVNESGEPHFGVFGYVKGEHTEITATADGQSRPVSGLSTEVYPGYTVFYDTAPWDEAWESRADITYGVPGGVSCSLQQCGTVG